MLSGPGLMVRRDGANTTYALFDGLGSVRQLTDSTGAIQLAQTYDPYGNPYTYVGPAEPLTPYGFAGEQRDTNGLVYLRARYYNSAQGRFFQMDPSRSEHNLYAYAASNPLLFTDPTGLCYNVTRLMYPTFQSLLGIPKECLENIESFKQDNADTGNLTDLTYAFYYNLSPFGVTHRDLALSGIERVAVWNRWFNAGPIGRRRGVYSDEYYAGQPEHYFGDFWTNFQTGSTAVAVASIPVVCRQNLWDKIGEETRETFPFSLHEMRCYLKIDISPLV